jgi:hypothetical protein
VGKKPPQSQKGGSHGLTPPTSAGLSAKEIFYFFIFIFCFFVFFPGSREPRGTPPGRLSLKDKNQFLFLFF